MRRLILAISLALSMSPTAISHGGTFEENVVTAYKRLAYFDDPQDLERCSNLLHSLVTQSYTEAGVFKSMSAERCFDAYAEFGNGALKSGLRKLPRVKMADDVSVGTFGDTLWIRVTTFDSNKLDNVGGTILSQLQRIEWQTRTRRILVDLRSNEGGHLDNARDVIALFAPKKGLVFMHLRQNIGAAAHTLEVSQARGMLAGYPVTFLVDQGTCSMSEVMIHTVREWLTDTHVAGKESTCGKAIVQQGWTYRVGKDVFLLKVTAGHWIVQHDWHLVGIKPDRQVDLSTCGQDYACVERLIRPSAEAIMR